MGYFPPDHGNYTDLLADDHTNYDNDYRGDLRHPPKAGGAGASGTWPISITGNAGTATTVNTSTTANNSSTIDGQPFAWAAVGIQTYLWGCSDGNQGYVTWEGNWARAGHNHAGKYSWLFGSFHYDVGVLAASTSYGPWTFPHYLQGNAPRMAVITGTYDDGVHSIVCSVGNLWDGTNVLVTARNVSAANEACALCMLDFV
jgi:hypothetical protein